MPKDMHQAKPE